MGILSVVLGHQVDSLLVNIAFFCNYLPCDLQMNGTDRWSLRYQALVLIPWPANKEDKMRSQGPHSSVLEYIYIFH